MANLNSYEENLKQLTKNSKDILEIAEAINETFVGNEESVIYGDNIILPSLANVSKRLKKAEDTIATFVRGHGIVETDDGTYRKIKVNTLSRPADDVTGLVPVSKFSINPNWFFELLQYPRCVVKIDLTKKIEDDSDRVYVNRIIIDANQARLTDDVKTYLLGTSDTYGELIEYLNNKQVAYKEDRDEVKLPLTYEKFKGEFSVIGTSLISTPTGISRIKYFLNTINYSTVTEDGIAEESGNVLNVGDLLRFNNTLFSIKEIDQREKSVVLDYSVGYETLGVGDIVEFYNEPFSEKVISVGIGANEIDIVYVKGVNENYNVLSREWSNPIAFYTNDLVFEDDDQKNFITYYTENVADFGKDLIGQIKEGRISSYLAPKPNAPTLIKDDLRVVQINTQLETTIDSDRYNSLTSEIASVKSNISSVRSTISANKDKLLKETSETIRTTIQNTINADTDKVNNLTTQFSSLVDELSTLLNDAGAINYTPKYHVRGFFTIPEPKYVVDTETTKAGKQQIIGFETMYRYLHTNETGAALNTFNYRTNDTSTGIIMTGVFTDWNLSVSPFLEKYYDEENDSYVWNEERVDGTHVVINQIDIPLRSGEKVEIKVRSISEAGYPYNPVKSDWSNSVIIEFPDNLTSDDSVTTILETVKSDMTAVVLQETLSSAGVYTHLADSNSQYKHSAENIEYTETVTDASGNSTVETMSLADKVRSLAKMLETKYDDLPAAEIEIPDIEDSSTGKRITSKKYIVRANIKNMSKEDKSAFDSNVKDVATSALQKIKKAFDDSSIIIK